MNKNHRLCPRLYLILLISLANQALASNEPALAYVKSGEHGQALLLKRLGECYAVTPAHVMNNDFFATLTSGTAGKLHGDADLLQRFGYDLSILRVSGAIKRACGGSLTDTQAIDRILSTNSFAVVASINENGSKTHRNVTISDIGLLYLRLKPALGTELFKGLSGSLVMVNNKPVGILMSVNPETGEGKALRYDRAIETIRPFFSVSNHSNDSAEIEKKATPGNPNTGLEIEIASWSSPPIGAEYRTSNLRNDGVWYAKAGKFPLELVLELPGNQAQSVSAVRLIGKDVSPDIRLPKDFEILTRNSVSSYWFPVSNGTYFKVDTDKLVKFAPVRAKQIMLRIYSNWGDGDAVGLSGVEILSDR